MASRAAPEHKALRTKLWEISGKRVYPQVFVNGVFYGGMDEIQVKPTSIRLLDILVLKAGCSIGNHRDRQVRRDIWGVPSGVIHWPANVMAALHSIAIG